MTERYTADWLSLREASDGKARSKPLAEAFLKSLPPQPAIVDLGAGTGANARYLEALSVDTGKNIRWRLIDRDAALLARTAGLQNAVKEETDFSSGPGSLNLMDCDGITASALFDLVSRNWFQQFARQTAGRPLLLVLTASDRVRWSPADPNDAAVMESFAEDMRRDKGFGPAMGQAAPEIMTECLTDASFRVTCVDSDWQLDSGQPAILNAMIDAFGGVASKRGLPGKAKLWRDRRKNCAAAGQLTLTVGHRDILAIPAPNRT